MAFYSNYDIMAYESMRITLSNDVDLIKLTHKTVSKCFTAFPEMIKSIPEQSWVHFMKYLGQNKC